MAPVFGLDNNRGGFYGILFHCPNNCGHSYKYRGGLSRHVRFECGKEPQFICRICKKKFWQNTHLKRHYLLHGITLGRRGSAYELPSNLDVPNE